LKFLYRKYFRARGHYAVELALSMGIFRTFVMSSTSGGIGKQVRDLARFTTEGDVGGQSCLAGVLRRLVGDELVGGELRGDLFGDLRGWLEEGVGEIFVGGAAKAAEATFALLIVGDGLEEV
jgi:hypothetical protein